MKEIQSILLDYLQTHHLMDKKIAIALSGGPDSMALYHAIKKIKIPDLVIHINHQMRDISNQEETELKGLLEADSVKFEIIRLNKIDFSKGNIEDRLRCLRFEAFSEILNQYGICNLLTGHQKNDAEETIFKRILEGSSIFNLTSFLQPGLRKDFTLHKPLIKIEKQKLCDALTRENQFYFVDDTNQDNRYLRGKMRTEIFPFLNQSFGKNIEGKFYDFGIQLKEALDYIDLNLSHLLEHVYTNPCGLFIPRAELSSFEMKWILSKLFKLHQITVSKDIFEKAIKVFEKGLSNKKFYFKPVTIHVERVGIFILMKEIENIQTVSSVVEHKKNSFIDFWLGKPYPYCKEKIPFFLRSFVIKKRFHDESFSIQF
jgi:tRNA(Ile)-lysidine synthase